MFQLQRFLLVALLLLPVVSSGQAAADDDSTRDRRHRQLLEKRQSILDSLQRDLDSVRMWCTEHELPDAEEDISELARQIRSPGVDSSPPKYVALPVSKSLPIEDQQWQLQLRHHHKRQRRKTSAECGTCQRV